MRFASSRPVAAVLAVLALVYPVSSAMAAPAARVQAYGSCAFTGDPWSWWPAGGTNDAIGNFRYRCSIAINDRGDVGYSTDVTSGGTTYRHAMFSSKGRLTDVGAIISDQLSVADVDSLVRDVNASGTVVGLFRQQSSGAQQRAFVWQPAATAVTELTLVVDDSVAVSPDPRAINGVGDVVFVSGFNGPNLFEYHAFVRWADGSTVPLPDAGTASPGGPSVIPADINGAGLVVGTYSSLDGATYHSNAFVWRADDATLTRLAPPEGFSEAWAEGVNASGQVVGMAFAPGGANGPQAVMWTPDGTATLLPWTYDAASGEYNGYSEATAINDRGVVVGLADNVGGSFFTDMHGVSWSRGRLTVLAPPSGDMSAATGVNRSGQTVGVAAASDDVSASPLRSLLWR
jgi:uncharacterized membrane protein